MAVFSRERKAVALMIIDTIKPAFEASLKERSWECFLLALEIAEKRISIAVDSVAAFRQYWTNLNVLAHHLRNRLYNDNYSLYRIYEPTKYDRMTRSKLELEYYTVVAKIKNIRNGCHGELSCLYKEMKNADS